MDPSTTKSCLVNQSREEREVQSRITSPSDECEEISASDRHHLQPLLGYDWIAGVLDAEDSLIERSDEFFNDLHTFRSLNKDECVHNPQEKVSIPRSTLLPPYKYKAHRRCSFDSSDSVGLPSNVQVLECRVCVLNPIQTLSNFIMLIQYSVCSQPYQADLDGNCLNSTTEYLLDGSNLCCKKCPPGTVNKDVRCERCPSGTFSDTVSSTGPCLPHTK
ncbi:Migration and invasion-inhibitory protein [Liparis tanakae]|uniref:Migration and invasion-inhibitory protein n=1 Tax=Liparis tanakae TaxID=230148 RepID=A0A4Z2HKC8_9TELE|nr:Migration and invasion-inhibitory protein [Liparis tanakae]